jgi:hypothetical protein
MSKAWCRGSPAAQHLIFTYLPIEDISRCHRVSKEWLTIFKSNALWRKIYLSASDDCEKRAYAKFSEHHIGVTAGLVYDWGDGARESYEPESPVMSVREGIGGDMILLFLFR